MASARKSGKKEPFRLSDYLLRGVGKGALFVLKSPYYLAKGAYRAGKYVSEKSRERAIQKARGGINARHVSFDVVKTHTGDYRKWENKIMKSDSKIGIIIGARGSGKTAFGVKFLENTHASSGRKCFALGFNEKEMPSWINVVSNVDKISNGSFVLIDEGGVLFNSRDSMSNANKMLSELLLIARHKNLSILFIAQNSSNLDVNILRQADYLVLKPSSLLQGEFERKIIQKMYSQVKDDFEQLMDVQGLTYVFADDFRGFVANPLPSFWKASISKSFG